MMNNSNYNMSGMISTGSQRDGVNYNPQGGGGMGGMAGGGMGAGGMGGMGGQSKSKKSNKGGMSALERKLERVNQAHRQQQAQHQMMMQQQQQQAMMQSGQQGGMAQQSGAVQGGHVANVTVPTAGGPNGSPSKSKNRHAHTHSQENMASLASFGFEAIEEDDITEASYKMSNLGFSEMDMTLGESMASIRSKSAPKMRRGEEKREEKKNRRASDHFEETRRSNSAGDVEGPGTETNNSGGVAASSVFGSGTSSSLSKSSMSLKKGLNMSMEDFNESFKSMEMEDRRSSGSKSGRGKLPDPDGAVAQRNYSGSRGRRDPGGADRRGGGLQTIHSARSGLGASTTSAASSTGVGRRQSCESMGISDPDMLNNAMASADFGESNFGVSLESLKSFQSTNSEGSSWLNQYNSMENVGGERNVWEDEEEEDASGGGSMVSGISAPRMVTATGKSE